MIRLGNSSPVIIDYGKSMVNDELILEMVTPCRFHDTLTLMMTSLHDLLKYNTLSDNDSKRILKFSNFIGNTQYTNNETFRNIKQLKNFIYMNKKFDKMLYSNKYELTKLTPLDLYNFL